jgi:hypothetical protein
MLRAGSLAWYFIAFIVTAVLPQANDRCSVPRRSQLHTDRDGDLARPVACANHGSHSRNIHTGRLATRAIGYSHAR